MVTSLSTEYSDAGKPVVFFEQDVDNPLDSTRYQRWWFSYAGSGSVSLPMVMVDSGNQISNGSVDYRTVYSSMVDQALARPPKAAVSAVVSRVGDSIHFAVNVTNHSGSPLSSSNSATLYGIVYEEEAADGLTGNFIRAGRMVLFSSPLADSVSADFSLQTADLTGVDWDKLRPVVFVDYIPEGGSSYDMLQAALPTTLSLKWQVTPGEIGNGSITPSTVQTVADQETAVFTLSPSAGNHVKNVTGSCPAGFLSGNQYTTGPIVNHCTVTAVFADDDSQKNIIPPLDLLLLDKK